MRVMSWRGHYWDKPGLQWVNIGNSPKESQNCRCAHLQVTVNDLSILPTMAEQLSREERLKLIHQNLHEVLKPEIIEDIVLKEDRPLKIYWGMAKLDRRIHCNC